MGHYIGHGTGIGNLADCVMFTTIPQIAQSLHSSSADRNSKRKRRASFDLKWLEAMLCYLPAFFILRLQAAVNCALLTVVCKSLPSVESSSPWLKPKAVTSAPGPHMYLILLLLQHFLHYLSHSEAQRLLLWFVSKQHLVVSFVVGQCFLLVS